MRFFHKFCSMNYIFLGLADGIMLSVKRKTKYNRAIEYLNKYSYALDDMKILPISDKYSNKIWQCWFQGKENMPPIVKKCTETVNKFHSDRVIFLDNNNIFDYVEFPDYVIDKYRKGIISHANFSDMLRLALIAQYGGTWIDSTIYLTDKIPDDILNAELFMFKPMKSFVLKYCDSLEDFKMYSNDLDSDITTMSSFFVGAKAGNPVINGVLNLFFEYWKHENSTIDYLMVDRLFTLTFLHDKSLMQKYMDIPMHEVENLYLLQDALFEKYDEKLFNKIKTKSAIHKLTHKNLHRNHFEDSFLNIILKK